MADIEMRVGLDVIRSYRRLAYTPWHALAEFIDNSTQSYRNNDTELDRAYRVEKAGLVVAVSYDRDAGVLRVRDNAMGMSLQELKDAVHIGKAPSVTSGRSQFGLGLKTAACWFGDKWTVRTKKLGEKTGHSIVVEVDKVASGQGHLPNDSFSAEQDDHFTEIAIEKMHVTLQGRRLGKTKESLRSMYRVDMRDGKLAILWDNIQLAWRDELQFLRPKNDSEEKQPIKFRVGKKAVKGWVGVLAPGSSGRVNAGFALIRRGRLIRGWPEAWRPEAIFGPPPGSNDLINQRITGEIQLDDFEVTHTKDDILWQENEEDEVQEGIKERIEDLLGHARKYRQPSTPKRAPRDGKAALDAVIEDSGLAERVSEMGASLLAALSELAPSEVLEAATASAIKSVRREPPLLEFALDGKTSIAVTSTYGLGADEPYVAVHESAKGQWVIAINAAHPACASAADDDVLRTHVHHVLADGILACIAGTGKVGTDPLSRVYVKDAVLRAVFGGDNA
jgi:hypothetical protein